ncbi:hypothetical protein QBC38DRAFT_488076 [Podospora fimiseda]|uniref:Uncharacterized protein n=1 Tax=Podospora fimiseda TaxID=252190 RepID=A0AAN7BGZ7_9PEZI|nr:hypothetical protein QBC38DRAFT_488076 [Podospora fimiseda]
MVIGFSGPVMYCYHGYIFCQSFVRSQDYVFNFIPFDDFHVYFVCNCTVSPLFFLIPSLRSLILHLSLWSCMYWLHLRPHISNLTQKQKRNIKKMTK